MDPDPPTANQDLPAAMRAVGPWGQLDAWNHPRLQGRVKEYSISSDVWIHANGRSYYMHAGTKSALVDYPGPRCSCMDFAKQASCIHVDLVTALRGPR